MYKELKSFFDLFIYLLLTPCCLGSVGRFLEFSVPESCFHKVDLTLHWDLSGALFISRQDEEGGRRGGAGNKRE